MSNLPGETTSENSHGSLFARIEGDKSPVLLCHPAMDSDCPHTQSILTTRIAAVTQSREDGLSFADGLEGDPGFCCFCRCFCSMPCRSSVCRWRSRSSSCWCLSSIAGFPFGGPSEGGRSRLLRSPFAGRFGLSEGRFGLEGRPDSPAPRPPN